MKIELNKLIKEVQNTWIHWWSNPKFQMKWVENWKIIIHRLFQLLHKKLKELKSNIKSMNDQIYLGNSCKENNNIDKDIKKH